uniref:Reverse transcriptase Ty1/copia-type domain-containing protein n=1 Tax=Tanacetum cinerariifolium TaxID=118510 RepID=A0A699HQ06_TANCI|nr:hypothetical protein [Tanacetum cinerariifolium]GEZ56315.1 hypothetical protein [Tanacetum cinerariifolium]
MYDNQVWNLVDTTLGLKTLGCKWIFKKKTDMNGKIHTYKARLVAKGYTQTYGIDYVETFSPVAKIKSIRIMLAIAAFHDYEIWQMDVKTAFFNEKLTKDVFMARPKGFENEKSKDESCIYVKVSESVVVFLVLYVDDILLIGNDIPMLQSVNDWMGKCFAMKDLGDAAYILGIKIYKDRKGNLPLHHGIKISKDLCPKTNEELDKMSRVPYASAIGSIMYAMMCIMLDVSFTLSMVSRHQQNPGKGHWIAVKNILNCQTDKDDSRSQSGRVFLLNEGVVTWKISKQDVVANSTCKSEYIAACEASNEAIWIER